MGGPHNEHMFCIKCQNQPQTKKKAKKIILKNQKRRYCRIIENMLYCRQGKTMKPGGFAPLLLGGRTNALQTRERRAITMYVTYSDLIQIGILVVALISLFYQIFKGKK